MKTKLMMAVLIVTIFSSPSAVFAWEQDGVEMLEQWFSCSANSECGYVEKSSVAKNEKKKQYGENSVMSFIDSEDAYGKTGEYILTDSNHSLYIETMSEHRAIRVSFKHEIECEDARTNSGKSFILADQQTFSDEFHAFIKPQVFKAGIYPIIATTTTTGDLNLKTTRRTKLFVNDA